MYNLCVDVGRGGVGEWKGKCVTSNDPTTCYHTYDFYPDDFESAKRIVWYQSPH